jgi:hypothetical protein
MQVENEKKLASMALLQIGFREGLANSKQGTKRRLKNEPTSQVLKTCEVGIKKSAPLALIVQGDAFRIRDLI